jgi:hypothetical protein
LKGVLILRRFLKVKVAGSDAGENARGTIANGIKARKLAVLNAVSLITWTTAMSLAGVHGTKLHELAATCVLFFLRLLVVEVARRDAEENARRRTIANGIKVKKLASPLRALISWLALPARSLVRRTVSLVTDSGHLLLSVVQLMPVFWLHTLSTMVGLDQVFSSFLLVTTVNFSPELSMLVKLLNSEIEELPTLVRLSLSPFTTVILWLVEAKLDLPRPQSLAPDLGRSEVKLPLVWSWDTSLAQLMVALASISSSKMLKFRLNTSLSTEQHLLSMSLVEIFLLLLLSPRVLSPQV